MGFSESPAAPLGTQGRDRFGQFLFCTGFETSGTRWEKAAHCWWCGREFPDKRPRRYCSEDCRKEYYRHFQWPWASEWCLERYGDRCVDCGVEKGHKVGEGWKATYITLVAHHIIPLDGKSRTCNLLNVPCNLIPLCPSCHQRKHAIMRKTRAPGTPSTQLRRNGYPPGKCTKCGSGGYWLLEWAAEEGYDPLMRKCMCRLCDEIYYLAPKYHQEALL